MNKRVSRLGERGFSLIELLVVITIVGIVLSIGLASLAATIRSSTKTTIFNQVKQSGDLAMETIARGVRNAVDVCTIDTGDVGTVPDMILMYTKRVDCAGDILKSALVYRCVEGNPLEETIELRNGVLRKSEFDSAGTVVAASTIPITSQVMVNPGSCRFEATNTVPKRITIDFTLTQSADLPVTPEYQVTIPFHSEVTLRNF